MMGLLNLYLKNGSHLVKVNNGQNSKKLTVSINGYYLNQYCYCCWDWNEKHVLKSICYISRFAFNVSLFGSTSNGRVFWNQQSISITLPLLIAITALARFIILQGKEMDPTALVYEAVAILLIAGAIVVLRLRHSDKLGLKKKKSK